MREIVFDTETTGLNFTEDRVIEIGCVEVINTIPTGNHLHLYINPQHPVHPAALKIHGLTNDFLKSKPTFRRIVTKFLTFIEGAQLVAHNASFDMTMLNAELGRLDLPHLPNPVVDTLALAREKLPGRRHSLDALCSHFGIDNSRRKLHGALLDSEILAEVYIELCGGRQMDLSIPVEENEREQIKFENNARARPTPLPSRLTEQELQAHAEFVASLGDKPIWNEYAEAAISAA